MENKNINIHQGKGSDYDEGVWYDVKTYKITSERFKGFIRVFLPEHKKGSITWSSGRSREEVPTVESVNNFIEALQYAQQLVSEHDKQLS